MMKRPAFQSRPTAKVRRRLRWLLLGLALVVFIGWATGAVGEVPLALALRAMWERDDDRARWWIDVAQRLSPLETDAELLLARIERHAGRFDRVASHLRAAESRGVDAAKIRREAMLASIQTGSLQGFEEPLNKWLAEADAHDRREICEVYANALAKDARFDDALRLLEAWRLDLPDDPQPDYRAGRIHEHLRQKIDAEAYYRAALNKNPKHYPAAYSLARVLMDRKAVKEALVHYRTCAELPNPVAANVGMARCLSALGRTDEARRLFREAAQTDEATRTASYAAVNESAERFLAAIELGKMELAAGSFEAAERWLRAAVENDPRDSEARYAWAVALRGLARREEAEQQFELVRVARKALDEAGKLHDQIERRPGDVDARHRLGVIYLAHGSEKVGLYWLKTALSYDAGHAPSHKALADYYAAKADRTPADRRLAAHHRAKADQVAAAP